MGYYTEYKITASPAVPDLKKELEKITNEVFNNVDRNHPEESTVISSQMIKWYNDHNDMVTLSQKYPETMFTEYGEDEECQTWKAYYQDGCHYRSLVDYKNRKI
jgi:hypothetical protein